MCVCPGSEKGPRRRTNEREGKSDLENGPLLPPGGFECGVFSGAIPEITG